MHNIKDIRNNFEEFANEIGKSNTWKKIIELLDLHAGFDMFRGGYVGVDVFFVISGYL